MKYFRIPSRFRVPTSPPIPTASGKVHSRSCRRYARSDESGAALILAIFVLAILLSLVVSMAGSVRVDLKASGNYTDEVQTEAILDGAVSHAMATLQNDLDTGQDNLTEDDWATLGENGQTTFPLGDGIYQLQIIDASSRVNLNTATRDQLLLLPGMTEEIADAIIDWRDEDDTPGASGAETDTYETYPRPYQAKNAPFDTVDELMMVQGITPLLLYGDPSQTAQTEDTTNNASVLSGLADLVTVRSYERNVNATGEARLNLANVTQEQLQNLTTVTVTAQQAQAVIQRRGQQQFHSVAELLDVRLPGPGGGEGQQPQPGQGPNAFTKEQVMQMVDLFTVAGARTLEGRVNVNTASLDVLKTLPDMTDEAANNIISRRPFASVGDLLDDAVMPEALFRTLVNRITTKSSIYIVRVRAAARPNGRVRAVEALVERTPEGIMRLLRRREVGRWPGWHSWGWGEPEETLTAAGQSAQP